MFGDDGKMKPKLDIEYFWGWTNTHHEYWIFLLEVRK